MNSLIKVNYNGHEFNVLSLILRNKDKSPKCSVSPFCNYNKQSFIVRFVSVNWAIY